MSRFLGNFFCPLPMSHFCTHLHCLLVTTMYKLTTIIVTFSRSPIERDVFYEQLLISDCQLWRISKPLIARPAYE
jgi:hypothetical protein